MEVIVGLVAILGLITIKLELIHMICIWRILIGFAILIIVILSKAFKTITEKAPLVNGGPYKIRKELS